MKISDVERGRSFIHGADRVRQYGLMVDDLEVEDFWKHGEEKDKVQNIQHFFFNTVFFIFF